MVFELTVISFLILLVVFCIFLGWLLWPLKKDKLSDHMGKGWKKYD